MSSGALTLSPIKPTSETASRLTDTKARRELGFSVSRPGGLCISAEVLPVVFWPQGTNL